MQGEYAYDLYMIQCSDSYVDTIGNSVHWVGGGHFQISQAKIHQIMQTNKNSLEPLHICRES